VNEGGLPKDLSSDLQPKLQNYDWPGNIRQLENTINRAMVISEGNQLLPQDFSVIFSGGNMSFPTENGTHTSHTQHDICVISSEGNIKTANEIEQEAVHMVLNHHNGNITQAAKSLGMAKSTFYKKIKTRE